MVNRTDRDTFRTPHFPQNRSSKHSASVRSDTSIDDIIASLANAPENRRARQVGEWERLRQKTFRHAV